jgi:hypothetical protein
MSATEDAAMRRFAAAARPQDAKPHEMDAQAREDSE